MYEQYYYHLIYCFRVFLEYLESLWNWWVLKIHSFPEIAITIVLVSILVLIVIHVIRSMKVVVHEGPEIHNLIRAIRKK